MDQIGLRGSVQGYGSSLGLGLMLFSLLFSFPFHSPLHGLFSSVPPKLPLLNIICLQVSPIEIHIEASSVLLLVLFNLKSSCSFLLPFERINLRTSLLLWLVNTMVQTSDNKNNTPYKKQCTKSVDCDNVIQNPFPPLAASEQTK